jgi:thioredoxin-related protein
VSWKGYREALSEARERGAYVFLFFYSYPCYSCAKMESDTFRHDELVAYLRNHFVSVRVDLAHSSFLSNRYAVWGKPTSLFLTPDGEKVDFLPGYVEPPVFLRVLEYIRGGHYRSKTLLEYIQGA